MATVRINTSDIGWIKRNADEAEVVPCGTDVKGVMYFQAEFQVDDVEHVKFAGCQMIRFDFGSDWPMDHTRTAMYPAAKYLVSEEITR